MRIIAGKYKYRQITLPKRMAFRPILSSIRESLFNTLNFQLNWRQTVVADVFAGSGVLGLESLSRGAQFCYFNDIKSGNTTCLNANLAKLNIKNAQITNLSYLQFLTQLFQMEVKLDLVFLTPPYKNPNYAELGLAALVKHDLLKPKAIIVVQLSAKFTLQIKHCYLFQVKKYGRTTLFYYQFRPKNDRLQALNFHHQRLIIFSGPSGVGKKSIINQLLEIKDLALGYSVSYTTRPKRRNEVPYRDYHFMTVPAFEQEIRNGTFLEYEKYLDNYYGTAFAQLQALFNQGKNPLLEIEIQGAHKVKKMYPKALWIFVYPPNLKELASRLEKRDRETTSEIAARLQAAKTELQAVTAQNLCDFYIENENLTVTVEKITAFLRSKILGKSSLR